MKLTNRLCLICTLCLGLAASASSARSDQGDLRGSVVKIHVTQNWPDLRRPWSRSAPRETTGSGVVIEGNRILTNAHVVAFAGTIFVQPHQSAAKLEAEVIAIAPGIDLAVLQLDDEEFFVGHKPLPISAALPAIKDTVDVYGYPVGGSDLSVTQGIVSRIEFEPYYFDTLGLRIQVDAALNPGNSGGPAVAGGQLIGLVFSSIREAENMGYIIPAEEIQLFLSDIADGAYDGKPRLLLQMQPLQNEALRAKLGLTRKQTGVMVHRSIAAGGIESLQRWDVLTHIGDHDIDNEGRIKISEDLRLHASYAIQKTAKNQELRVKYLRDGQEITADLPVYNETKRAVGHLRYNLPSYLIFGPLVFSPATQEYVDQIESRWISYMIQRGSRLLARRRDPPAFDDEQLVMICSSMFSHKITKGYHDPVATVVTHINAVRVTNFRHLVKLIRNNAGPFISFSIEEYFPETLVFRYDEMKAATEDVLNDNGIRHPYSEDVKGIWEVK